MTAAEAAPTTARITAARARVLGWRHRCGHVRATGTAAAAAATTHRRTTTTARFTAVVVVVIVVARRTAVINAATARVTAVRARW